MAEKQATVKIGHLAQQFIGGRRAFALLLGKSIEEQRAKEAAVEPVLAALLTLPEFRAQIIAIVVQKLLLLNEIDEHQPVQHHGSIPRLQPVIWDTLDEVQELLMLGLEAIIKALGDSLGVECGSHAPGHLDVMELLFLIEAECDGLKLLNKRFATLTGMKSMLSKDKGFAGLTSYPLPDLLSSPVVRKIMRC